MLKGGSILSTRCSETFETKTALMSLFGLPLWYFTQSPRVVIQVPTLRNFQNLWFFNQHRIKIYIDVEWHQDVSQQDS